MKLIITDQGDSSVGIFPRSWDIDAPFEEVTDPKALSVSDIEEMDLFRKDMTNIYKEYCEGRISASYDFELKIEFEEERALDEVMSKLDNNELGKG